MSDIANIWTSDVEGAWYNPATGAVDATGGLVDLSATKTPPAFLKVWAPPTYSGQKPWAMFHPVAHGATLAWNMKLAVVGLDDFPVGVGGTYNELMALVSGIPVPLFTWARDLGLVGNRTELFPNRYPYLGIVDYAETVLVGGNATMRFRLTDDRDLLVLDEA